MFAEPHFIWKMSKKDVGGHVLIAQCFIVRKNCAKHSGSIVFVQKCRPVMALKALDDRAGYPEEESRRCQGTRISWAFTKTASLSKQGIDATAHENQ